MTAYPFSLIDTLAAGWFFLCWVCYAMYYDYRTASRKSLLTVMDEYRLQWMREMLMRENRMMDETLIGNLLRSITFFASTSILLVLGITTLFKYQDEGAQIIMHIPGAVPAEPLLWETKILLLTLIFVYAFFKYTWSLRQYNYACIMVGAAPDRTRKEMHEAYAQRGARLVSNAARHFNMGLRSYYFGFAAMSWFLHPFIFMLATAWVVFVVYRREFRSFTLMNLAG